MSDFTQVFEIDFPPGNGVQVFAGLDTPLGLCDITEILISFPPGCAGNVGISISYGGSTVYPVSEGNYFVFDDYTYVQEVSNQKNGGAWHVNGFNSDYIDHTVQVIYKGNYVAYSPDLSSSPPVAV